MNDTEVQLRLIADFSPALIARVDQHERYQFMNRLYKDWFGFEPLQSIGKTILEVVGPIPYAKAEKKIKEALQGVWVQFENRVFLKDGTAKDVDLQFVPITEAQGGHNGFIILGYDITPRKEVEQKLRRTSEILQAIMTSSQDLIYVKDRFSRMVYCNPTTLKLANCTASEINGKTDVEFLGPNRGGEEILRADKTVMDSGIGQVMEEWVTWADGSKRLYMSRKEPRFDEHGHVIGMVGISRDITELIQAKEEGKRFNLSRGRWVTSAVR
jgi:PAS domain S-box-containing protein